MIAENDRISADEALDCLERQFGGRANAKASLAEMLQDGKLVARAERSFVSTISDINEAWASRNLDGAEFDENFDVDASDWRGSVQWSSDIERWRWPENRFVITIQQQPFERQFFENVSFERTEIERLVDGRPPTKRSRNNGGRRPDLVRWEWFWMEVAQLGRDDKLVFGAFPSQEAMTTELLEAMQERYPSEKPLEVDSIKPRVRQIWERFCEQ